MSELIDRQALRAAHGLGTDCNDCKRDMKSCQYDRDYSLMDFCEWLDDAPTASPWRRVEEPPLPNQDLWLHDEHGYYHVGYISTYRGYTEYIDMDGNALHGIDYWMPIEPPKEE